MRTITILLLTLSIFISCKKDSPDPSANILVLNSSIVNNASNGFSCSKAEIVPSNSNPTPDFHVLVERDIMGNATGVFLSNSNLEKRFYLKGTFPDLASAKNYFNSCTLSRDTVFQRLAVSVKPFQIWIIKTNENKFGKILIHEATYKDLNNSGDLFAEVKFQWLKFN